MYRWSIIALAFWGIQTILGGDTLYQYINKIPGISDFSSVSGDGGISAIIYSIQPTTTSILYGLPIPRNCGFAWEPGGYAIYLCLAIFINLFMTNPKNKFNLKFWVLLLALLSTQSTTGYSIFIVIILFYYLNKRSDMIVFIMPLLIVASISVFLLPFMSKKIITFIKDTNDIDYIVWQSIGNESGIAPQRFTSFLISFRDFYNNPILGNAGITGESWYSKIGANISPISGIGNLLANLGIIGFLFFMILTIKTSIFFSNYFNYKGKLLFFIIILFISISYSVIFVPLVMTFWMFKLFFSKNDENIKTKYSINNSIAL
ncbi:MAG TPA: hypothetical protein VFI29_09580 [Hanamia sp.]|nr:hypothetical protein [Hanamia sp.]